MDKMKIFVKIILFLGVDRYKKVHVLFELEELHRTTCQMSSNLLKHFSPFGRIILPKNSRAKMQKYLQSTVIF